MATLDKSALEAIIKKEILYAQGVQTRTVLIEKYTRKQQISALANALANLIVSSVAKQMEQIKTENERIVE